MSDAELINVKPGRMLRFKNAQCVYCDTQLEEHNRTQDHVIGRRFVPKGTLSGQTNVVCNACKECNRHKSDLEDDISAITLLPGPTGWPPDTDPSVIETARRKASRSKSRRSNKRVALSHEDFEIEKECAPGFRWKMGFVSGPQLDRQRVFELAHFHIQGLFYSITYREEHQRGWYWPGCYMPLRYTRREDWGNSTFTEFAEQVVDWEPRILFCGANGYFLAAIRRHPTAECWSWALEWNRTTRVIGFIGDEAAAHEVAKQISSPKPQLEFFDGIATNRVRQEQPLKGEDDRLFEWPEIDEPDGE